MNFTSNPLEPQPIDTIVERYRVNPADPTLDPPDILRLIAHFDATQNLTSLMASKAFREKYSFHLIVTGLQESGLIAYAEGRLDDSIRTLTALIKHAPDCIDAYVIRGMCYAASQDIPDNVLLAKKDFVAAGKRIEAGLVQMGAI